jgi:hypothetical protein
MRLLALAISLVIGTACGGVNEAGDGDGDGDGDAGETCGGTVDTDGNCICEPRFAPPACDTCAEGWTGASCESFADDFGRGAGPLGPTYLEVSTGLAEAAVIVNGRACGDVQSVGVLAEPMRSRNFAAQVTFDPGSLAGQEVSFLFSRNPDLESPNGLFFAGCDGGGDACTLRIGEVNQVPLAESATPIDLTAGGSDALIELSIDGSGNIFLTLTQLGMPETNLTAQLATPFDVERFGFIVGREPDGSLSCIDDLQVTVEVD